MDAVTSELTRLRTRIQWLRRRERCLLERVNGPRYPTPSEIECPYKAIYVCRVGEFDGYVSGVNVILVDKYGQITSSGHNKAFYTPYHEVVYDTWKKDRELDQFRDDIDFNMANKKENVFMKLVHRVWTY